MNQIFIVLNILLNNLLKISGLIFLLSIAQHLAYADVASSPYIDIYDPSAFNVIDKDAEFSELGKGYAWSEGPVWVTQGDFLLFSDVPNNVLYKYTEQDGVSEYLRPSGATALHPDDSEQGGNGLLISPAGQLVIMQHGDRRVAVMDAPLSEPLPSFKNLATEFKGKRLNSPNDGVFHSNGDLYFTDPPYGLKGGRKSEYKDLEFDGIFRLSTSGKLSLEDDSILFPNGIIFSNDESFAIVAASNREKASWYRYDVTEDGSLINKTVFFDATDLVGQEDERGLPDGMAMHSEGYLFATGPGGVFIFTEAGKLLAKIRTGRATANCTLSADEKTLYITAHDTLMSVQLK